MTRLSFRNASILDKDLLNRWSSKPHVLEAVSDAYWDWEEDLSQSHSWREQIIVELDMTPIGFIQIIDPFFEPTRYWGNVGRNLRAIDIWIGEEDFLNQGFGTLMMKEAISRCFSDSDVTTIYIDPLYSNIAAQRFYRRIGFISLSRRNFDNNLSLVMILTRQRWSKMKY